MKRPSFYNHSALYPYYTKHLLSIPPNWLNFTGRNRMLLEHFIDREQRTRAFTPRESQYVLEHRLKTIGTLRPGEIVSKSVYTKTYHSLLWLYNICAAAELNPRLSIEAYADLVQWKDIYECL